MRIKALGLFAALPLTSIALTFAPAQAAPQILALMATIAPVPMTCVDGTCTAELSAVCLQERRPTPSTGTVYRPAEGTDITMTVTGPDGVSRTLRVEAALSFTSLRQYNAVKVSLPEATVRKLGGGAAALSVGPMASIVPIPVDGDPEPLSAGEIANYTGPLRAAAEDAFRRDSARVNATRILNQMVNRLPTHSGDGIEKADALWKKTVGTDVTAEARQFLNHALKDCRETMRIGVQPSLRSCLSYQHDYLSGENTTNAWRAMRPES
jgi:hypothetical protein